MALSILPVGTTLIAGGFDGVLRQTDDDRGAALFVKQFSFYYEAGLTLFGATLSYFGTHPDLAPPTLYGGAFRMGSRVGYWAGQPGGPRLSL